MRKISRGRSILTRPLLSTHKVIFHKALAIKDVYLDTFSLIITAIIPVYFIIQILALRILAAVKIFYGMLGAAIEFLLVE